MNAIINYQNYFYNTSQIAQEAGKMLEEKNIKYSTISCSMIPSDGLCLTIELSDIYTPDVVPVAVFFNYVKTKEDIKLYAI